MSNTGKTVLQTHRKTKPGSKPGFEREPISADII